MAKDKVVLAYSGGLDTSCCIRWLQIEKNLDVIAVVGEIGQEHGDLQKIQEKAMKMGALDCRVVDMRKTFADDFLTKEIAANGLYEEKYPLISALSRPLLSQYCVQIAHDTGAKYIAHGCTGKGNDQVRFETSIEMLDPDIQVIVPVREWDFKTRPEEMEWAQKHGAIVPTTKASPYSIDENMFGRSIECGILENPWNEPPKDIWKKTVDPADAPDTPTTLTLGFKQGIPTAINGEEMDLVTLISKMDEIAGENGYGRLDVVENRLVGLKSRECYEAPGALAIITAHKALEDLCLERELLHEKSLLEQKWATNVYNGQWFGPLMQCMNAFIQTSQRYVTGEVRMDLYKGTCTVTGRKSDYSLYDYRLATYDREDNFDHDAAAGFCELYSLPAKTWAANRRAMRSKTSAKANTQAKANAQGLSK